MATLNLTPLILTVCFVLRVTDGQALGFVLNGVTYTNGSTVLRDEIGEGEAALQCTTDRDDCCRGSDGAAAGEFYFPNGDQVPILGDDPSTQSQRTYYRNRGFRFIRLNRRSNGVITGQFRCEIPDASGTLVNIFINIVDELPTTQPGTVSISLSITASGTNTAGETYNLECSATVTGSTDQPTITWLPWLDPMNNPVPSEMVTTTGSMSTLTFNPLAASHAGTYTCRAIVGSAIRTKIRDVTLQIPGSSSTISIFSYPTGAILVGSTVTLTCTVELSPAVDVPVTVTIEMTDPVGNQLSMITTSASGSTYTSRATTNIASSDQSGIYTCRANISSTSRFLTTGSLMATTTPITVVLPPPLNVQATQSSASVPVEVSWSPPSSGATNITGYRIFYGNGVNVSVPAFVRSLGSTLEAFGTPMISIRSESSHTFSDLVNVTVVTVALISANNTRNNNAAAIALGVVVLLVVLIAAAVVAVLVVMILRQKPVVSKPADLKTKEPEDVRFSSNVAYGQVKIESTAQADVYKDLGGGGPPLYATAENSK